MIRERIKQLNYLNCNSYGTVKTKNTSLILAVARFSGTLEYKNIDNSFSLVFILTHGYKDMLGILHTNLKPSCALIALQAFLNRKTPQNYHILYSRSR